MNTCQILLPFYSRQSRHRAQSNLDLVGSRYFDGEITVTVIGVCRDDRYVMVRRRPGKTSPMLAWLMRLIFAEEHRKLKGQLNRETQRRSTQSLGLRCSYSKRGERRLPFS